MCGHEESPHPTPTLVGPSICQLSSLLLLSELGEFTGDGDVCPFFFSLPEAVHWKDSWLVRRFCLSQTALLNILYRFRVDLHFLYFE